MLGKKYSNFVFLYINVDLYLFSILAQSVKGNKKDAQTLMNRAASILELLDAAVDDATTIPPKLLVSIQTLAE